MGETWFQREFLAARRLAFNFLFYGSHFGIFAYGWWSQQTNVKLAGLNTLGFSVWISRGAGLVLAYDGGLILIPMLRNIIRVVRPRLTWLFPADENIWFHRQVAYSMAFWAMVHTTAHYVNFINVERAQLRKQTALQIHYTQPGGITGHFMLLIMLLMYTTAHHKIRQQCFEAFWYTHHLAFFFHDWALHPRYRVFCTRFGRSRLYQQFPILLHQSLSWLSQLEVHHLAWHNIFR